MTDKTPTERLRELLDERGVEWLNGDWLPMDSDVVEHVTVFNDASGYQVKVTEGWDGGLHIDVGLTPEQAIAATLGRGTCHAEEVYLDSHSDLTATVCSACHIAVDDLEDCDYCPWCGAKVVDE